MKQMWIQNDVSSTSHDFSDLKYMTDAVVQSYCPNTYGHDRLRQLHRLATSHEYGRNGLCYS